MLRFLPLLALAAASPLAAKPLTVRMGETWVFTVAKGQPAKAHRADARTSLGPSCKTPCSLSVPAPDSGFSITFAMDRFEPQTVQVQVIRNTGAFNTAPPIVLDPNPVVVELQSAGPPPKAARRARPHKPRLPKSAAAPAESVFPNSGLPPR